MTEYKKQFPFPVLFPPSRPDNVIAEWLSKNGLHQMHVAGTTRSHEKLLVVFFYRLINFIEEHMTANYNNYLF